MTMVSLPLQFKHHVLPQQRKDEYYNEGGNHPLFYCLKFQSITSAHTPYNRISLYFLQSTALPFILQTYYTTFFA